MVVFGWVDVVVLVAVWVVGFLVGAAVENYACVPRVVVLSEDEAGG